MVEGVVVGGGSRISTSDRIRCRKEGKKKGRKEEHANCGTEGESVVHAEGGGKKERKEGST